MLITIEETTVRELRSVLKEINELLSSLKDCDTVENQDDWPYQEDITKLYRKLTDLILQD